MRDGLEQGRKQEKLFIIKKLLNNKLKKRNDEINFLLEDISIEKIEELENKIFEIETFEDVEEIVSK